MELGSESRGSVDWRRKTWVPVEVRSGTIAEQRWLKHGLEEEQRGDDDELGSTTLNRAIVGKLEMEKEIRIFSSLMPSTTFPLSSLFGSFAAESPSIEQGFASQSVTLFFGTQSVAHIYGTCSVALIFGTHSVALISVIHSFANTNLDNF
ncbi:hypothetical protein M0R45_035721 [Rubus argutus]|uniref:Uncharacterized protein n=1 Tax=Rubus argutus TaxID=59490 RepID=A0AAW1VWI6_RUBAR